jgi:lipopolysaccharide export system protein LptA
MPLKVYRLRRLLAATAVLLALVVTAMYFYARHRATNVLKQIPGKIGYDIKQTASGFQFSKSDGKRTLFTIQATDFKEFRLNGNAELHNVSIVLYGRDSTRFDQIYGDDFAYNQKTGDVTAKGDVQIDLVANPAGLLSPDQSTPKELKNPIHLKTRDLVFNKETGNAMTAERVEFRMPQASGWAIGVKYAGKSNTLTLSSQIHVVLSGPGAAVVEADRGVITNDPREIVLDHPHLQREDGKLQADQASFQLGQDNQVERILATGNVSTMTRLQALKSPKRTVNRSAAAATTEPAELRSRADQAEFLLVTKDDLLRTASLTGNVRIEQTGPQPMLGEAGRVILDFANQNQLQKVHAIDGVRLAQSGAPASKTSTKTAADGPQDFELTAPIIDFTIANGHMLERAVTSGAAQIVLAQAANPNSPQSAAAQRTTVTANQFQAQFADTEGRNHLTSIHGAPRARIVSSAPGQPDRVSTSDSVDATFVPQGGIEFITQQGNIAYADGLQPDKRMQATANFARYTPADHILVLTGTPRISNGGMDTTASTIRINRTTGDAVAEGIVKSTYSQLQEQPDGALLASSSPIHVTARTMTAHNSLGVVLYSGNARLWQDANIIEAPTIQFDRERRSVTAQGTPAQPVQTILVQAEKSQPDGSQKNSAPGQNALHNPAQRSGSSPISITGSKLTYVDSERKIHYEGGVVCKGADFTASANTVDAYLLSRSQITMDQSLASHGQLDHMVAQDNVVIQQANRRADGQKLAYTVASDQFVLTGGPPSIFDAEQGKITGVSLTFFRHDDRVLVEGGASTPVVTQTRVAR